MAMESSEWTSILRTDELPLARGVMAETPWGALLVFRTEDRVYAISNVCAHQGAALHRGSVDVRGGTPISTCPAHGSMFDMSSGVVRRGPAMHPVAAYDAKIEGDTVVVRPRD